MPAIGDRHREPGALDLEWTGRAWAPVCPTDNVAMTGRTARGELCCTTCGRTYMQVTGQAGARR